MVVNGMYDAETKTIARLWSDETETRRDVRNVSRRSFECLVETLEP